MMRTIATAVACMVMAVATAGQAQAGFITNNFGLSNPAQTITFDEFVFTTGTSITNQYSSLGVTFSPNLFYSPNTSIFPNMNGNRLGNFWSSVNSANPFSILFSTIQNDAAFAMVTNQGTSTFTALLNGTAVESFSATTNTSSTSNYFGFTNIYFDEIRVNVGGANGRMLLDNLQTSNNAVVPEPTSLTLFGIGAWVAGLGAACRRRRKTQPQATV